MIIKVACLIVFCLDLSSNQPPPLPSHLYFSANKYFDFKFSQNLKHHLLKHLFQIFFFIALFHFILLTLHKVVKLIRYGNIFVHFQDTRLFYVNFSIFKKKVWHQRALIDSLYLKNRTILGSKDKTKQSIFKANLTPT